MQQKILLHLRKLSAKFADSQWSAVALSMNGALYRFMTMHIGLYAKQQNTHDEKIISLQQDRARNAWTGFLTVGRVKCNKGTFFSLKNYYYYFFFQIALDIISRKFKQVCRAFYRAKGALRSFLTVGGVKCYKRTFVSLQNSFFWTAIFFCTLE